MKSERAWRWSWLVALLGTLIAGCGMSEEEATSRCSIEEANRTACFNDEVFDQCVDCYLECGDKCEVAESCPVQFVCPE